MLRVVEVIGRSSQGVTRPFLCRADDGLQYYVKGTGAGRQALINEWMAGYLGKSFGLPLPHFDLIEVTSDLVRYSARPDLTELGPGIGFASQMVPNTDELSYSFCGAVDPELAARILLFDWWVRNADRTLTIEGGNVNLLWTHRDRKLHVIDHNLAFDAADMTGFWDEHVFRDRRDEWTGEFIKSNKALMSQAIQGVDAQWHALPEGWTEIDTGVTLAMLVKLLSRFETEADKFWKR